MRVTEKDRAVDASKMQSTRIDQSDTADSKDRSVAVLMCTYNGADYLREQLDSIGAQTFDGWTLYVSDDGSTDATLEVLSEYQLKWGQHRVLIFDGPRKGFAENFISLVRREQVKGTYFAFSDQDDIWFTDKLERSITCLESLVGSDPALYCSRTRLVDSARNVLGVSPLFSRAPAFENALVQSIAGANTMVINQPARDLLMRLPENMPLVAHDWLAYILVSGSGGKVVYDARPTLDYRQHSGNLIGANATFVEKLRRLKGMLSGRFARWNDANLTVLNAMAPLLSEQSRRILADFDSARSAGFFKRLASLRRAGVYRQTTRDNVILLVAACLGRI